MHSSKSVNDKNTHICNIDELMIVDREGRRQLI